MSHCIPNADTAHRIRTVAEAGTYIKRVCFKHGPPRRTGVELEWLLHDPNDPDRYPDAESLAAALGPYAPRTLSPGRPPVALPFGGSVTVEPGGQIELSSAPASSVAQLIRTVTADTDTLCELLAPTGFTFARHAADPHRAPRRLLYTPRYDAMAEAFDAVGPAGQLMMCSTAATQVCVDLGTPDEAEERWRAAHQLGPVLLAAFANSPRSHGPLAPATSTRMSAWWQLDPVRTLPPRSTDPADYVRRALDTPVMAIRRDHGSWRVPEPLTLRRWAESGQSLTSVDIDLHLSMMFPPVRPQGYLELRYLDAQPPGQWVAPLAVIAALFSGPRTVGQLIEATEGSATRWEEATRIGLADPALQASAAQLAEIADHQLGRLGLDAATDDQVRGLLRRRLVEAISPADDQLTGDASR